MDETKQILWKRRMEEFRTSGKTQTQYASELGVRVRTFQYWHQKFKQGPDDSTVRWMEVKGTEPARKAAAILLEIDGVRIAVTEDYNKALLKSVIQTLKES
jgi:hypothetical protein